MLSNDEIISRIIAQTGKSESEILERITFRRKEFPDISDDGIVRLVANEFGTNFTGVQQLKIGSIVPNMQNISFVGKIVDLGPVREFNREGRIGKVMNIIVEDETGKIRFSLWNEEVDNFRFDVGENVKANRVRTRRDNFGNPEARISYGGSIEKTESVINVKPPKNSLSDVAENDDVVIEATLLHVFERNMIYYFCPKCRAKLMDMQCPEHGTVEPVKTLIVSGLIDDGKASINAAFFGSVAEKVLGRATNDIEQELSTKDVFTFVNESGAIAKKFKLRGSIRRNQVTNDLELRVRSVY